MPPTLDLNDLALHCKDCGDIHPELHCSGRIVFSVSGHLSVLSGDHCAVYTEIAPFMQSYFFSMDLLPGEGSLTSKA